MAKKSIVTSIRFNEDDYQKLKALKEKSGVSWTKFIDHANELISEEMEKTENDDVWKG